MVFYRQGWQRLPEFDAPACNRQEFISVLIAARNEEENIAGLLFALQQQTYPQHCFEIILSDDFSVDETVQVAKNCGLRNLKIVQPRTTALQSSKKQAIAAAVEHAAGNLLVVTDADCLPPRNWLQVMNGFYQQKRAAFIAAPVQFSYNQSLLQRFQALDFLMLQGITAASVGTGFHAMCNGANLAYQRSIFYEVNGFSGIDKKASGDDMLLMHKIKLKHTAQVCYLKSKDAIVTSAPVPTWKAFFNQRRRWGSKNLVYDDFKIIVVLIFVYLLNLFFLLLLIAACFNSMLWILVAAYLLVKPVTELILMKPVAKFYNRQILLKYLFLLQAPHIFYTVWVGAVSQFGKYEWKGRITK